MRKMNENGNGATKAGFLCWFDVPAIQITNGVPLSIYLFNQIDLAGAFLFNKIAPASPALSGPSPAAKLIIYRAFLLVDLQVCTFTPKVQTCRVSAGEPFTFGAEPCSKIDHLSRVFTSGHSGLHFCAKVQTCRARWNCYVIVL